MRQNIRTLGLCLLAIFAFGAVMAAGASAFTPEWGQCKKTESGTGGKYADSACIVKAKQHPKGTYLGEYEWTAAKKSVRGTEEMELLGNGRVTFETAAGYKIECTTIDTGSHFAFELPGGTTNNTPYLKFRGCVDPEGKECNTGEANEEINNALEWGVEGFHWKTKYGYIETGSYPVVGVAWSEEKPEEALYQPFLCTGASGTWNVGGFGKGGNHDLVGVISPVNHMGGPYTVSFSELLPGIQAAHIVGDKAGQLQANIHNHSEPVAITATFRMSNIERAGPVELKATP